MRQTVTLREKFVIAAVLLLPLLLTSYDAFCKDVDEKARKISENKSGYTLTIQDNAISLDAHAASLKEVLEDIGRRMEIEVESDVPEGETVTLTFVNLPLEEAIKKLSANYVYLIDSESEKGKITKIVVLREGKGTGHSDRAKVKPPRADHDTGEKPKPEPFKFEFDPSQHLKEGK